MNEKDIQHLFHKSQMEKIKKECKEVVYIAHTKEGQKYYIDVKVRNETGGRDNIRYALHVEPSQITSENYDFILSTLKDKGYGTAL